MVVLEKPKADGSFSFVSTDTSTSNNFHAEVDPGGAERLQLRCRSTSRTSLVLCNSQEPITNSVERGQNGDKRHCGKKEVSGSSIKKQTVES